MKIRIRIVSMLGALCALQIFSAVHATDDVALPAAMGSLVVSHAWTRAMPAGVPTAGYVTIENRGTQTDILLSVSSPVAAQAELHRTTVRNGLSTMRPEVEVAIAVGEKLMAKPGGLHIMFTGMKQKLAVGSQIPLTLTFRHAGAITVHMSVQPLAAAADEHAGPSLRRTR